MTPSDSTPTFRDYLRDPMWWADGLAFIGFLAVMIGLIVVLGAFTGAV